MKLRTQKLCKRVISLLLAMALVFSYSGSAYAATEKKSTEASIKSQKGKITVKIGGKTISVKTGKSADQNQIQVSMDKKGNLVISVLQKNGKFKKVDTKLKVDSLDVKGILGNLTIAKSMADATVNIGKSTKVSNVTANAGSLNVQGEVTKKLEMKGSTSLEVEQTATVNSLNAKGNTSVSVQGEVKSATLSKNADIVLAAGASAGKLKAEGEAVIKVEAGAVVKSVTASDQTVVEVGGNVTGSIAASGTAEILAGNGSMIAKVEASETAALTAEKGSYLKDVVAEGESSINLKKGSETVSATVTGNAETKIAGAVNDVKVAEDANVNLKSGSTVANLDNAEAKGKVVLGFGSTIGTVTDSSTVKDNGATIDPNVKDVVQEKEISSTPNATPTEAPKPTATPKPTTAPTATPTTPPKPTSKPTEEVKPTSTPTPTSVPIPTTSPTTTPTPSPTPEEPEPTLDTVPVTNVAVLSNTQVKVTLASGSDTTFKFGIGADLTEVVSSSITKTETDYTLTVSSMAANTNYTLEVARPGYKSYLKSDLQWIQGTITVTVLAKQGNDTIESTTVGASPLNGATVTVSGKSATTTNDGVAKISPMSVGTYVVNVSPAGGYQKASASATENQAVTITVKSTSTKLYTTGDKATVSNDKVVILSGSTISVVKDSFKVQHGGTAIISGGSDADTITTNMKVIVTAEDGITKKEYPIELKSNDEFLKEKLNDVVLSSGTNENTVKLSGLVTNGLSYQVSSGALTTVTTATVDNISISKTEKLTVYVTSISDSAKKEFSAETVSNSLKKAAAPTNVGVNLLTGIVTGVTGDHKYSIDGGVNWVLFDQNSGFKISTSDLEKVSTANGLWVRVQETDTTVAGEIAKISISQGNAPTLENGVTIHYINETLTTNAEIEITSGSDGKYAEVVDFDLAPYIGTSSLKIRTARTENKLESAPFVLNLTRPEAPTAIESNVSIVDSKNIKVLSTYDVIIKVSTNQDLPKLNDPDWVSGKDENLISVSGGSADGGKELVTGDKIYLRKSATTTNFKSSPSAAYSVNLNAAKKGEIRVTVAARQENGFNPTATPTPMQNVSITIISGSETETVSQSASDGTCVVKVSVGSAYTVKASAADYAIASKSNVAVTENTTTTITLELKSKSTEVSSDNSQIILSLDKSSGIAKVSRGATAEEVSGALIVKHGGSVKIVSTGGSQMTGEVVSGAKIDITAADGVTVSTGAFIIQVEEEAPEPPTVEDGTLQVKVLAKQGDNYAIETASGMDGATITVLSGSEVQSLEFSNTVSGEYSAKVSPGTYTIKVSCANYSEKVSESITVEASQAVSYDDLTFTLESQYLNVSSNDVAIVSSAEYNGDSAIIKVASGSTVDNVSGALVVQYGGKIVKFVSMADDTEISGSDVVVSGAKIVVQAEDSTVSGSFTVQVEEAEVTAALSEPIGDQADASIEEFSYLISENSYKPKKIVFFPAKNPTNQIIFG